ncbi:subtilisin-like protein [Echria macrotheca]|uniref:Subtilisin-like protein n=1 Tax=Echria macrotheca TaxID=438768 RepID=A0AAJ0B5H4_9PEZI|nr:subtilisin-like protein [Echria macrotheca]
MAPNDSATLSDGWEMPGEVPSQDARSPREKVAKMFKGKENKVWEVLDTRWRSAAADAHDLDSLASNIVGVLINQWILAKSRQSANDDIETFLKGAEKAHQIDDCVRWQILLNTVKINQGGMQKDGSVESQREDDARNAQVTISKIIIQMKPYLAFENTSDDVSSDFFGDRCLRPRLHQQSKEKTTPFHAAAKWGNYMAVKAMIEHGKKFYSRPPEADSFLTWLRSRSEESDKACTLLEIVQEPDPESKSEETAMGLAANATHGSLETLEALFDVDGIANPKSLDKPFSDALDSGLLQVVNKFLEHEQDPQILVTHDSILRAIEKMGEPIMSSKSSKSNKKRNDKKQPQPQSEEDRKIRFEIVKSLFRKSNKSGIFSHKVVQTIIHHDLIDVWEAKPKDALKPDVKECLLHLAVLEQNLRFVELFTKKEEPGSDLSHPNLVYVTKECALTVHGLPDPDGTRQFPLWYNNHRPNETGKFVAWPRNKEDPGHEIRTKIRDKVVNSMICEEGMESLLDIFQRSHEPFGDLCFDISRFNSGSYRISKFVDSLTSHSGNQRLLSYEQTLRYVEFPSLDAMVSDRETYKENSHLESSHEEVFKILDWLYDKGVRKILKLKVPDRLVNPHDDRTMAEQMDRFQIERLDWKVTDLSVSIFSDKTKARIKELHLYSSGKRAVISHWLSDDKNEGVRSLTKLELLEIKVIQETTTPKHCNRLIAEIRDRVNDMKQRHNWTFRVGEVLPIAWYPTPEMANLSEIAYRIAPKLARWLLNLAVVVKERKKAGRFTPTAVAILDNGILSVSHSSLGGGGAKDSKDEDSRSLWSRIEDGCSFIDEDSRLSPWLFASNPHGTQMANLICAIDPFCKIYVARVAEDSFGITAKRVAKAIEWARNKKVDVISMSFVIGEKDNELANEIRLATNQGIVMTCSSHDEGSRIAEAYPAKYMTAETSLMVLAACDEYGQLLREVKGDKDGDKFKYMVRGQHVAAGVVPFLAESEEPISGSSVSTALAAGLCSLILTCDRLANPGKTYPNGKDAGSRWEIVTGHLDSMQSTTESKFVLLEKFGQIDTPRVGYESPETGRTGGPSAKTVLTKYFKGNALATLPRPPNAT